MEIRSQSGQSLGEGKLGDVWVKSPSLMSGVLGEADGQLIDGWLQTGDAGFLVDGELHLYGRRRDILLLDGRNHDPSLVEHSVETLDEVRRCCAFTQETSEERDDLILLCEVEHSYDGTEAGLEEKVRNRCRRQTTLRPDKVVFLTPGDLPVTSSGKLKRKAAADAFARNEFDVALQGT